MEVSGSFVTISKLSICVFVSSFVFIMYDFSKTYYQYYYAYQDYKNSIRSIKTQSLSGMFFHDPVSNTMPHDYLLLILFLFIINVLIYTFIKVCIFVVFM